MASFQLTLEGGFALREEPSKPGPRRPGTAWETTNNEQKAENRPLWWSESWSMDWANDEVYDDEAWPEHPRTPEPPD